jgi:hypothetical protein
MSQDNQPTEEEVKQNILRHQKQGAAAYLKSAGKSDAEIKTSIKKFAGQQEARLSRREELRGRILSAREA